MWTPISFEDLYDKIIAAETLMTGNLNNFWNLIKTEPTKWSEKDYGKEGGGFWVVAICGQRVIWYNDIEEGFNVSLYAQIGTIGVYWCDQDDLHITVQKLFYLIQFGGQLTGQASSPTNLD